MKLTKLDAYPYEIMELNDEADGIVKIIIPITDPRDTIVADIASNLTTSNDVIYLDRKHYKKLSIVVMRNYLQIIAKEI